MLLPLGIFNTAASISQIEMAFFLGHFCYYDLNKSYSKLKKFVSGCSA